MSGIEELQQRVAAVEQQFGLAHEQRTKCSARLLDLMDAVETRLREQQGEIGRQADELSQRGSELTELTARFERGERENEQLRGILHSLLQAIEAGTRDVLSETMQALDAKVSSLIAGAAAPADEAQPLEEPSEESADLDAAVADEPAIVDQEDEAVDPADHAAPEVSNETAEPPAAETSLDQSATLAAIMRRVGKLIDEDEAAGMSEESDAGGPADPAAETEVAEAETQTPQAAANT